MIALVHSSKVMAQQLSKAVFQKMFLTKSSIRPVPELTKFTLTLIQSWP